jgi:hypothetical protein
MGNGARRRGRWSRRRARKVGLLAGRPTGDQAGIATRPRPLTRPGPLGPRRQSGRRRRRRRRGTDRWAQRRAGWRRRRGRGGGGGGQDRRRHLGRCLWHVGRRRRHFLGRRCRLVRLNGAPDTECVGLASGAVGLGILDAGRMALDTDPEIDAEIERLLVGEPELPCQLVDPDLLRQLPAFSSPVLPVLPVLFVGRPRWTRASSAARSTPGRQWSREGWASILARLTTFARSIATASGPTCTPSARSKARRRTAASRQPTRSGHSQAPRPEPAPRARRPSAPIRTRSSCAAGRTARHPTQVRRGPGSVTVPAPARSAKGC